MRNNISLLIVFQNVICLRRAIIRKYSFIFSELFISLLFIIFKHVHLHNNQSILSACMRSYNGKWKKTPTLKTDNLQKLKSFLINLLIHQLLSLDREPSSELQKNSGNGNGTAKMNDQN